ncbi:MAG: SPOR domain-containing protein, partial [Flavobacteriales bacterium]|nr:SPOR domain-containing protein [Flavobacteriales bacterium]
MLIDKYIENALYLYQCVIVPGFGGFLALEKEASTD